MLGRRLGEKAARSESRSLNNVSFGLDDQKACIKSPSENQSPSFPPALPSAATFCQIALTAL